MDAAAKGEDGNGAKAAPEKACLQEKGNSGCSSCAQQEHDTRTLCAHSHRRRPGTILRLLQIVPPTQALQHSFRYQPLCSICPRDRHVPLLRPGNLLEHPTSLSQHTNIPPSTQVQLRGVTTDTTFFHLTRATLPTARTPTPIPTPTPTPHTRTRTSPHAAPPAAPRDPPRPAGRPCARSCVARRPCAAAAGRRGTAACRTCNVGTRVRNM